MAGEALEHEGDDFVMRRLVDIGQVPSLAGWLRCLRSRRLGFTILPTWVLSAGQYPRHALLRVVTFDPADSKKSAKRVKQVLAE